MGAVIPGLVLAVAVRLDRRKEKNAQQEETTNATVQEETVYQPISQIRIPVLSSDGVVTEMDLETYLCGVVLAEMPVDFETEALKAQSVVARTFALRRYTTGTKHPDGAVCTDPACCQGYFPPDSYLEKGGSREGVEKVQAAVLATSGQVLTYRNELIEATYFSCSGGKTEDAVAVWGNDVPYLQSTSSPGEENAVHFTDTVTFTPAEVSGALGVELKGPPDVWFGPITYTDGGGVDTISVCGREFTGVEMRKLLNLRSTAFSITASEEAVTVVTHGYGHRVGMSQYGADAMAASGSDYEEILSHYYQSTELVNYPIS